MSKTKTLDYWIQPHVLQMKGYTSARDTFQANDQEVVLLDANENPNPWGYNRYPDPYQRRLRKVLAARYGLESDYVMLGNGSDEILDLLFRATCQPGKDQCIALPPTYGMYKVLSNLNQVPIIEVPLDEQFQPRVGETLAATTPNTKLMFLCSPNNPTGNLLNRESVEKLLQNFDGLVVIDEAYVDFASEPSWVDRLDMFPNLVVVQTLSKAYGMAGLRLGMCYANPQLIRVLLKIKPPYNINEATQKLALSRLDQGALLESQRLALIDQRIWLQEQLKDIFWVETVFPSQANFVLVRIDDANMRYKQALDKGFVLRNRHGLPGCQQCLRITVGTQEENKALIQQLKKLT